MNKKLIVATLHSITEIELAYDFKGVLAHSVTTMLGVAPSMTYIAGQGWVR